LAGIDEIKAEWFPLLSFHEVLKTVIYFRVVPSNHSPSADTSSPISGSDNWDISVLAFLSTSPDENNRTEPSLLPTAR